MNLDTGIIPYKKFNSKCITYLHIKCKTMEDNKVEILEDIEYGYDILDTIPKA